MNRSVLLRTAFAAMVCAGVARAERPAGTEPWDPGEPTTSKVGGEPDRNRAAISADGAYGRFDGLFDIGLAAGAAVGEGGAAGAALASLRYFSTAGIYASYEDALGGAHVGSERLGSIGVDLTPLFIPRWSNDMEGRSAFSDLTLDSFSIALGGYLREPRGQDFGHAHGLEFSLGVACPLMSNAAGLWLGARSVFRWDDPGRADAPGARFTALLTLGYHFIE
jgi:hypothetical protein